MKAVVSVAVHCSKCGTGIEFIFNEGDHRSPSCKCGDVRPVSLSVREE